jgi:hypothetical protein
MSPKSTREEIRRNCSQGNHQIDNCKCIIEKDIAN